MKAWAKVCALLVLVLAMAAVTEGGEKKGRGICPDGKKACQYGDDYICINPDKECPKPIALPRGICPDDKKACQIGEDEYVCVGLDDECP